MSLARPDLIRNITYDLTHLEKSIESLGKIKLLDLNVAAEHFYKELLNKIFQYELKNLNTYAPNTPAIDLGDEKSGVAFQVTAERRSEKIQRTIDKFASNGLSAKYPHLKILVIGKRTGNYSSIKVPQGISFNTKTDIVDTNDLIRKINSESTALVRAIHDLIKSEINPPPQLVVIEQMSEKESLGLLRDFMDRSALQDKWNREYSYRRFGDSMTEMIEAIATGRANGTYQFKSMFNFKDNQTRKRLKIISDQLKSLRSMLTLHINSGEIDTNSNTCNFKSNETEKSFDASRRMIVHTFNSLASDHGIPCLPDTL